MTNPYQIISNSPQNSGNGDTLFDASEKINVNFALWTDKLLWGNGSPEGMVTANPSTLYEDRINGTLYIKRTGNYNAGWVSATAVTKADLPVDTVYTADLLTKLCINSGNVTNGVGDLLTSDDLTQLIPTMTSNSAPSGTVTASDFYTGYEAYKLWGSQGVGFYETNTTNGSKSNEYTFATVERPTSGTYRLTGKILNNGVSNTYWVSPTITVTFTDATTQVIYTNASFPTTISYQETLDIKFTTTKTIQSIKLTGTKAGTADVVGANFQLTKATGTLKTKTGGSYPNAVISNIAGTKTTLSTEVTLNASAYANGTYNNFVKTDGSLEAFSQAIYGKDLLVDFSQGNANDNYGLHTATIIGSPAFTGNKFNSNGTTGLYYAGITHGTGTWCKIVKFKSTNTSTIQTIMGTANQYCLNIDKTTANKINFAGSSNNTSWDISLLGTKADWAVGTEYYLKAYFTGTQYKVDWSTDYNPLTGIGTWTNDITITNSTPLTATAGITFGYYGYANNQPLIGTMDDLQVTIGNSTCLTRNQFLRQPTTSL